jgi:hypothetical protein
MQENSNPCAGAAAMQVSCLILVLSTLQVFDFGYLIPMPQGKMGGVTIYQFPPCVWEGGEGNHIELIPLWVGGSTLFWKKILCTSSANL